MNHPDYTVSLAPCGRKKTLSLQGPGCLSVNHVLHWAVYILSHQASLNAKAAVLHDEQETQLCAAQTMLFLFLWYQKTDQHTFRATTQSCYFRSFPPPPLKSFSEFPPFSWVIGVTLKGAHLCQPESKLAFRRLLHFLSVRDIATCNRSTGPLAPAMILQPLNTNFILEKIWGLVCFSLLKLNA